ncbi:MAG TPA: hypothetical protein VK756_06740 [Solirubrobacteraceae bacterium]|nr:hypothetical protein [Solirubrobacteraceae bacterium]
MVFVSLLAMLLFSGGAADAAEAKLGIKRFTIQTTEPTEEKTVEKAGETGLEFVNKPYTFTQAGGHPWGLTTTGEFTSEVIDGGNGEKEEVPTRDVKDIAVNLPPGLLGDPMATPRCALTRVLEHTAYSNNQSEGLGFCPADTQIGTYELTIEGGHRLFGPIVNVTPAVGESAEFALEESAGQQTPLLTAHLVRVENPATKQHEYGFTVISASIPLVSLERFELTFWGVPADASHNAMRGRFCLTHDKEEPFTPSACIEPGGKSAGVTPVPFLSLPTDCAAGPETATIRADSWEEPGSVQEGRYSSAYVEASATLPGVTGCGGLSFDPGVEVQPDTLLADAPVGLGVDLQVPQSEVAEAPATPHVRDAVITLPEGLSISPGIVDGIQACNESGPEGINFEGGESEEVGPSGELQLAAGHCPAASIVGTAEAVTPLLPEPVRGHVYLARPLCGGAGEEACTDADALDGRLYQLYLELGGTGALANTGINIKAHGYVEANPATGQLTTKFLEDPQAPFSELKVHLNGGPRAPLDNPAVCGSAVTTSDLTPWSAPGLTPEGTLVTGLGDATPSSFYTVEGCASPPGLRPGFSAGTVSPQAGAYSAFTLNLTRGDREQYVKGIQVHTPPGLLGMLSTVTLCEEAQADSGSCPQASRIGTTRVASGAGSHPFEIEGTVYLTKGYGGAPFGLSIVTDAVAGPFNLGLVVVRARIDVDRETSALTITTDETGAYAVPQILDGVPLRLKEVTVNIDRPGFMFNPTSCAAKQITAVVSGSGQASANVTAPFAASGCKSLAFKPSFQASTSGHTSRAGGASLDVRLSYPAGSVGVEANIASVKVSLPKQLPSRLTTLQKACPAAQFQANPAGCPQASIVGVVRASTPLLPVGLTGPAYFVSHGGEAFPSLVVVLQGDGVRVDLTGSTFISAQGITSSTFKTVPDVPVGTFELYLPEGNYSALAANSSLCKTAGKLVMPTELHAQNGAVIHQNTKITVTGCNTKPKKTTKHRKTAKKTRASRPKPSGKTAAAANRRTNK